MNGCRSRTRIHAVCVGMWPHVLECDTGETEHSLSSRSLGALYGAQADLLLSCLNIMLPEANSQVRRSIVLNRLLDRLLLVSCG